MSRPTTQLVPRLVLVTTSFYQRHGFQSSFYQRHGFQSRSVEGEVVRDSWRESSYDVRWQIEQSAYITEPNVRQWLTGHFYCNRPINCLSAPAPGSWRPCPWEESFRGRRLSKMLARLLTM